MSQPSGEARLKILHERLLANLDSNEEILRCWRQVAESGVVIDLLERVSDKGETQEYEIRPISFKPRAIGDLARFQRVTYFHLGKAGMDEDQEEDGGSSGEVTEWWALGIANNGLLACRWSFPIPYDPKAALEYLLEVKDPGMSWNYHKKTYRSERLGNYNDSTAAGTMLLLVPFDGKSIINIMVSNRPDLGEAFRTDFVQCKKRQDWVASGDSDMIERHVKSIERWWMQEDVWQDYPAGHLAIFVGVRLSDNLDSYCSCYRSQDIIYFNDPEEAKVPSGSMAVIHFSVIYSLNSYYKFCNDKLVSPSLK